MLKFPINPLILFSVSLCFLYSEFLLQKNQIICDSLGIWQSTLEFLGSALY